MAVVENALILAAIWKKTFQRTPFHILLSNGLVRRTRRPTFCRCNHFCLGKLWCSYRSAFALHHDRHNCECQCYILHFHYLNYLLSHSCPLNDGCTCLEIPWWHRVVGVSQPSSFCLFQFPWLFLFTQETINPGSVGRGLYISITAMMLFRFLTTFIAYFIVLRAIRGHQQQVQANEKCPNFAQPAINLAKYKKSVFMISYILALAIFGFFPFIVSVGVYVSVAPTREKHRH